jgi:hypothetical protein
VRGVTNAVNMVDLFPITGIVKRFLVQPILLADPFLVVLGYASALGLLLHRPHTFSGNAYRSALFGIVILGTGILALMSWSPLRYWMLLVPAYLLLALEWNAERTPSPGNEALIPMGPIRSAAAVGLLAILMFGILYSGLVLFDASSSRLGEPRNAVFWTILAAAAVATIGVWWFRVIVLNERTLRRFTNVVLAAVIVFSLYRVAGYVAKPSWDIQAVRQELSEALPDDAVFAGDWAPLFTLGTHRPTLYMNSRFNRPERIHLTRPTHFLYCQSEHRGVDDGMVVWEALQNSEVVKVGESILETSYIGRRVALYPLEYDVAPAPLPHTEEENQP